jgi:hypothetical protein
MAVFVLMAGGEAQVIFDVISSGGSVVVYEVFIIYLFLLSALLCFFVGNRAFRGSALGEIHLVEPSAADELGESVGVVPVKVQKGETHSLLMDFDIVGRAPTNGRAPSGRYYEVALHAPGVDIDADKRHTLFEPPATLVAMWNCFFRAAGNQAMHIVLEAVTPPEEPNSTAPAEKETLFAYAHDVAVESTLTASKENALGLFSIALTVVAIIVTIFSLSGLKPIL